VIDLIYELIERLNSEIEIKKIAKPHIATGIDGPGLLR
jgi:hypothetical protein